MDIPWAIQRMETFLGDRLASADAEGYVVGTQTRHAAGTTPAVVGATVDVTGSNTLLGPLHGPRV